MIVTLWIAVKLSRDIKIQVRLAVVGTHAKAEEEAA
jgi:hypothetical protein